MRLSKLPLTSLLLLFFLSLGGPAARAQSVDLHAHLFFFEGSGVSWLGDFDSPIRAKSWKDRFRSKINESDLLESNVRVVGVALYAHPLMMGSLRGQIRNQIARAEKFVRDHGDWVIAKNPAQARLELSRGKRILVLTLEGASGVLENEEDLKEFVDGAGIRIVTPMHFMDDAMGGAALLPGWKAVASPVGFFKALWTKSKEGSVWLNPIGLRDRGKWLIDALIARKVWIDLAHASDRFQVEVTPLLMAAGQPFLHSHTMLRRYYEAERGISTQQLFLVKKTGGLVGLIPSEDMVGMTPHPGDCLGGVGSVVQQWREMAQTLADEQITLSSDINAPIQFLPKGCDEDADGKGFFRYAQMPELWDAMSEKSHGITPEGFVKAWDRLERPPSKTR